MNKRLFTKAVATMLGASLAVSGVPALALAAEGGAQTGDAAVTAPAEKTAYGASVTASVTSATTVTFAGYSGWKNKRGEGAAMANPTVTITSGDTTFAQDAAIGEGGAVTLSAPVAVGSYTAVISSDNYNDVTASFDYPALTDVVIGGAAYQYLDASKALSLVDEAAQAEALKEFTQIGQTSVYYKLKAGSTALAGTLYGMDMSKTTKYADLYQGMGAVNATAENFDAISSATQYTSHHAGDIPSIVAFGTDEDGNKVITGIKTALLGVVCAGVSVLGDLTFSVIKREKGIKDYGKIMPGHGGLTDRFDSVLFVVPMFYVFVHLFTIL